jgi:GntR family transcriptional repressor for pyruvate dehydrogenase complex
LLRRAIADGQVKVGERFPSEREMASQLGVGRLVVREAIRSLESAALIKVKRGINGGCFVCEATPGDVSRSFSNLLHMARISLQDLLEVR